MSAVAGLVTALVLITACGAAAEPEAVYLGALVEVDGTPAVRVSFAGSAGSWSGLCRKGTTRFDSPALPKDIVFHVFGGSSGDDPIALAGPFETPWVGGGCLFALSPRTAPSQSLKRHRVPGWDGWNEIALLISARSPPRLTSPEATDLSQERKLLLTEAFLATPTIRDWCEQDTAACSPGDVETARSFSFPTGHLLAEIKFKRAAQRCDQDPYSHCSGIWMVSRKAGASPQVLDELVGRKGEWSSDLELLAVSDLDGDSQLEYLFWLNAYNENGFVLYYDDFGQHAVFSYNFH